MDRYVPWDVSSNWNLPTSNFQEGLRITHQCRSSRLPTSKGSQFSHDLIRSFFVLAPNFFGELKFRK